MKLDVRNWISASIEGTREDFRAGFVESAYRAYLGAWYTVSTRRQFGTNVYERNWDVLVVLDACRLDALHEVADEYDFLSEIGRIVSVGSASHEWLAKTFTETYADEIGDTTFVTPNGFAERLFVNGEFPPGHPVPFVWPDWDTVDASDFDTLDITWKYQSEWLDEDTSSGGWDIGPPRTITDRALSLSRELDVSRLVVHYYQPHTPYLANAVRYGDRLTEVELDPWSKLESGDATREEVWQLYLDNLRLVLDEVEILLDNVDADTVAITADHGDLFGEWNAYGHPEGLPHPDLKVVPWVETTATNAGSHEPEIDPTMDFKMDVYKRLGTSPDESERDVEEHLRNLGYR